MYLRTYFATKKFSNMDIAVKKKGVDRIVITTTIVVAEISLLAS